MNYRYWAEQRNEVQKTQSDVAEEPAGAKHCPKCSGMMTKYRIGNETQNRLELCAHCDEVWLDAGEWDLVKNLDLHNKLSSVFTDAWQRNIRLQKETDNLRAYYSALVGAEAFKRLEDLKQWIDQHEKRGELLHYLNTRLSK